MYLKRQNIQLNVIMMMMMMMDIKTFRMTSSNIPVSYIEILNRNPFEIINVDNTVPTVL